jgi:biopolymer transport protein ExbD
MTFGSFQPQRQQSLMSDINVTPMVDVMLVLLVIFIITAPMLSSSVKLELPQAAAPLAEAPGHAVTLAIDAQGTVYWNDQPVDAAALEARMIDAAGTQPELQLRVDRNTRYEAVARVMATAQQHGLNKLGFVTDPHKEKQDAKR